MICDTLNSKNENEWDLRSWVVMVVFDREIGGCFGTGEYDGSGRISSRQRSISNPSSSPRFDLSVQLWLAKLLFVDRSYVGNGGFSSCSWFWGIGTSLFLAFNRPGF